MATIYKPYDYQKYCIDRIVEDPAVALFLDMGLGKTSIALSAIDTLRNDTFEVERPLIIAPLRVAQSTWAAEAQKWQQLEHLRVVKVLGSAKKRIEALMTPGDVHVINRENVEWLVDYYRASWPFDMLVIDELSSFKNGQAKRFKALKLVRPYINRIVGLTGTPAPNGLTDLWAQIYLLDQGARLGKSVTEYRKRYFYPGASNGHIVYEYKPKNGAQEAIDEALSDICISMRSEDYLSLPECVTVDTPVVLGAKVLAAYKKLEKEMLLEYDDETIDASSAAVLSNKLLQLCNGAVYGEERVDGSKRAVFVHDAKIEALMDTVEGLNGQHALVFYGFRHDLGRIKHAMEKKHPTLKVRELRNEEDQKAWNAGEIDILLAHPASCAYGLNLQEGGHHVIWFGLTWSLELYQQANKRLHRQGQKDTVIIHRLLVESGLDLDVAAALEGKRDTQDALLDALKARIRAVK